MPEMEDGWHVDRGSEKVFTPKGGARITRVREVELGRFLLSYMT